MAGCRVSTEQGHMDTFVANLLAVKLGNGKPSILYSRYPDIGNVGVVRLGLDMH